MTPAPSAGRDGRAAATVSARSVGRQSVYDQLVRDYRPEFRFYYFTTRYEETVAFYRDSLGLPVYRTWHREDGDRGTIFIAPNSRGLIEIEDGARDPAFTGGLYIEVPDLEFWYKRVRESGAPLVKELGVTSYGHENFKTRDPSGVEVTFFRYVVEPEPWPQGS